MTVLRLLLPLSLAMLAACSHRPSVVELNSEGECPQRLQLGQSLTVTLPSNPTTGFRWTIQDSAGGVLRALSPEVYSSAESGVIGGGGQSTWRFQAFAAGQGRLRLTSQQPWEPEAEPTETFDCAITVN